MSRLNVRHRDIGLIVYIVLCLLLIGDHHEQRYHVEAAVPDPVGKFELLLENAGIASMHTAVTRFNTVIMLDRTDIGPSLINLPNGICRNNPKDLALKTDCTAHSVMFTPGPNTVRPLMIFTDTWCSSGQFLPNGTMLQTGGDFDGLFKIRRLDPCPSSGTCDWFEDPAQQLTDGRWYSTNALLPDGSVILIGGRNVFTYEFVPKRAPGEGSFFMPFLNETNDFQNDNYYPYVHLLPDGNLYIFANRDSILFNYKTNAVLKRYPTIPGEPRNYPSAGSSVILPIEFGTRFGKVEVLICGGAQLGAFKQPSKQFGCSQTCGRMEVTAAAPTWFMETMPMRRCMGDMLLLPTRDVVIINGAQNGSQGFKFATNPALNPLLYRPRLTPENRFLLQPPATIPRMYHCTANLLADGRIFIAGSNSHMFYTFTGDFPTELRLEAWSPPYLDRYLDPRRPTILNAPDTLRYGQVFTITFAIKLYPRSIELNLLYAPFTTHSYSQGQRLLSLRVSPPLSLGNITYSIDVTMPTNPNVAPAAYYMMFPVTSGVPGKAKWIQLVA